MTKLFKRIEAVFLISTSIMLVMSCGKNEEKTLPEAPSIFITSSQLSVDSTHQATANDEISFSVTVNAPGGFAKYSTTLFFNSVEISSFEENNTTGTTELIHTSKNPINFITTEDHVGDLVSIEIIAFDDNDLSSTLTVGFTVQSAPADVFSSVILADSVGNIMQKSFFSTNTGVAYSPDSVNSSASAIYNDIDFGYFYDVTTDSATIASPQGFTTNADFEPQVSTWNVKNSTTLLSTTLNPTAFNNINTWADIETAYTNGSGAAELKTKLVAGNVIAFQTNTTKTTSPGKKGLILVKLINGTVNPGDSIELDIVVQR